MDEQTLHTLCRQFAAWAQSAIDDGGYPFRKVELFPPLVTASGPLSPPLVFWINRDSFMAGGIIFFPDSDPEEQLAAGKSAAEALGIDHFTTWDRSDIIFWRVTQGEATAIRTLTAKLPTTAAPADYHSLLLQLLGAMKTLAVGGMLPPEILSPYYFANLYRMTLQSILPGLREQHRRERANSSQQVTSPPPDILAEAKATMILLRLVALIGFDRLPASVQPEGLEQASRYALDTLPRELRQILAFQDNELGLSGDAAIRFHHLLRRLTQLHLAKDLARAATTLEMLLGNSFGHFGGIPLPYDCLPTGRELLLVNPAGPHSQNVPFYESAELPLLAFFSLIRAFRELPGATAQFTELMHIDPTIRPHAIYGALTAEGSLPPTLERTLLSTQLRASWPGRRWQLPPGTPRWAWEFLHLLGLAAPKATIDLTTPGWWLTAPFGPVLFEVLVEEFFVHQVRLSNDSGLRFHLSKEPNDWCSEMILNTPQGERRLPSCRVRQSPGQVLALALSLSDPFFALLAEGILRPATTDFNTVQISGARHFFQSSLGQLQSAILGEFGAAPTADAGSSSGNNHGQLLPDPEILEALGAAFAGNLSPTQEEIDRELRRWLPHSPLSSSPVARANTTPHLLPRHKAPRERTPAPALEELLIHSVFSDGIPLFPEHYLYAYLHPETASFDLPEPLSLGETFFEHAILTGAAGTRLEIKGLATAQALTLCAHSGQRQVRLPVDQAIVRVILDRYLADLRRLHSHLRQLAHQHLGSSRQADNLAARLWKRMRLPPVDMFND